MPETKQLLRETRDRIAPPPDVLGGLERRRRHKENVKRAAAAAVAIVVALVGLGGWFILERNATPQPADRSEELGIFAPVAGRIVYENEAEVGDLGYDLGLWAVDPSGPSDTAAGPSVADDVVSTLVRLDLEEATPLGWSSDGTELLFMRSSDDLFPQEYLYILHADGSETRLNRDPMYFGGATISPDGTRVVFAVQAVPAHELGLYVVDAEGGQPARLPLPEAEGIVMAPTFSPDGTQIAYLDTGNRENHVWVTDADGSNAREILANEATLAGGVGDLQWSPAGDRIAMVVRSSRIDGTNFIYTFAPDGSDFIKVITGGVSPYWSPDGSQIAFTIVCDERPGGCEPRVAVGGLGIADADGSNVREFGFAASGPWHPADSARVTGEAG
jgi:Tol biopolymer transport system component